MTTIIPHSVFTKTAKGILEARNKGGKLPRDLAPVFLSVDGKSTVGELHERLALTPDQVQHALATLVADGYVKIVQPSVQPPPESDPGEAVQFNPSQSAASGPQPSPANTLAAPAADVVSRLPHVTPGAARANDTEQANDSAQANFTGSGLPELQFDGRAHELTARVHSERRARDEAGRRSREAPPVLNDASGRPIRDPSAFPALELTSADEKIQPTPAPLALQPLDAAAGGDYLLPTISLDATTAAGSEKHTTPDHVPSALERAMMQTAARAQAAEEAQEAQAPALPARSAAPPPPPPVVPPSSTQSSPSIPPLTLLAADAMPAAAPPVTPAAAPQTAADKPEPTLDDEPLHERLNVDRATHDVLAEAAAARKKAEVAELTRSAAAARRQRVEEDARRAASAVRDKKRRQARTTVIVMAFALPALAIAWLQFVPLNSYVPDAQQALSERFNQPATISTVRYVLLPSPRVVLEGVRIGSAQGIRVERVDAHAWPTQFVGGPIVFSTVEASGVEIDPGMLAAIPSWTGGRSAGAVHVNRLKLSGVKLSLPPSTVEGLAGDVTFAPNGTVTQASLANENVTLGITPQDSGIRVVLSARDWRPPFGFPMNLSHLSLDGVADKQRFATTALSARIGGGSLEGTLAARWEGPMIVGGQIRISGARLDEIMPTVVPDLAMKGFLAADVRYAMQADSATGVLGRPLVEGTFAVTRGEIVNIDLLRAVQGGSTPVSGGRTAFDELKGSVQIAGGEFNYRNLQLSSGPLGASGHVEVAPGSRISGRINAQLSARGAAVARSSMTLSGTLKDPRLTR